MAQQNTDNIQQNLNRRDIRRNSSNQIVSYSIPDTDDLTYGIQKIPVIQTRFKKEDYNKTIEMLSDEFITPLPEVPLEAVKVHYIDELKIYKNGVQNPDLVQDEFEDVFSGRYELSNDAPTKMEYGRDKHSVNPSYWNSEANQRGFRFTGPRRVYFDTPVYGPPLEENGYRITKELIDSGKSIRLKTTVGVANQIENTNVGLQLEFNRKRSPDQPYNRVATQWISVPPGENGYPFLSTTYDVLNEDMREGDVWSVHLHCGNTSGNFFQYGRKSIFIVDIFDADNPADDWPTGVGPGGRPDTVSYIPGVQDADGR